MAVYAVGDIQGCYAPLAKLLDAVNFDPAKDTLYCVGDLVNRGLDSLFVLRLLKSLEKSCKTVLGNHDLHLLSIAYGVHDISRGDTLKKLLKAKDADELIAWLRKQSLLLLNKKHKFVVTHAGIYPFWNLSQARQYACEVEQALQDDKLILPLLKNMYGNTPANWKESLVKWKRLRFIVNSFTRMRYCTHKGKLNFLEKGPPPCATPKIKAWYELLCSDMDGYKIIFGHWSSLGFLNKKQVLSLDTGCVWGGPLTMVRLDTEELETFQKKL